MWKNSYLASAWPQAVPSFVPRGSTFWCALCQTYTIPIAGKGKTFCKNCNGSLPLADKSKLGYQTWV